MGLTASTDKLTDVYKVHVAVLVVLRALRMTTACFIVLVAMINVNCLSEGKRRLTYLPRMARVVHKTLQERVKYVRAAQQWVWRLARETETRKVSAMRSERALRGLFSWAGLFGFLKDSCYLSGQRKNRQVWG